MKGLTAAMIAVQQNANLLRGTPGQDGKAAADGLTWRGTFAYGTTYQPGDVVEWEGSSYVALVVTARRPPDPEWDLLAAKGEAGASGRGYIRGGGGSSSGSALEALDEGVSLSAAVTSFDFTGAGITATAVGNAITVDVPAGGVNDATYLVGAAHAGLSAEIVVGATPGGELGGTWASPTVDATHSGSSHASLANVYVQSGDPGAVGAGKVWVDTSNTPEIVMRWRNDDDTIWRQLWKATPTAYIVGQNDGTTPGIDLNNDGALELDAGEAGLYISMNEGAGAIYGVLGEALVSGGADNVVWGSIVAALLVDAGSPADATKYLDGTGAFSVPAGGLTQPQVMARAFFGC